MSLTLLQERLYLRSLLRSIYHTSVYVHKMQYLYRIFDFFISHRHILMNVEFMKTQKLKLIEMYFKHNSVYARLYHILRFSADFDPLYVVEYLKTHKGWNRVSNNTQIDNVFKRLCDKLQET